MIAGIDLYRVLRGLLGISRLGRYVPKNIILVGTHSHVRCLLLPLCPVHVCLHRIIFSAKKILLVLHRPTLALSENLLTNG
jgi:hypothetical protein